MISLNEAAALLAMPLPTGVTTADAQQFIDRWNQSVAYWQAGIFNLSDVPPGQNTNFIALDQWSSLASTALAAGVTLNTLGFADPIQGVYNNMMDLQFARPPDRSERGAHA